MNYEKFNDAMCRLRQAEEDFNKAIQDIQTGFNEYEKDIKEETKQARWEPWSFDNVVKETKDQELREKEERQAELQTQIDEAYNKGLKDMHEALCFIAAEDSNEGMSIFELNDTFGTDSVCNIILGYSPQEIMDKTLAWATKRKESQELHVGDEIEYTFSGREPEKCIVIGLDDGIADEKIIWTISSNLSSGRSWFSSKRTFGDSYRKTGKHYDAIPFPKKIK